MIENDDESDFKTPVKLARIFTDPLQSSKAKPRKRYTKKKSKENLVQKSLRDKFSSSDCNPEHLQLALALSKSEQSTQNDDSKDEVTPVYPSTQQIKEHAQTTLEKFRFKTKSSYYDPPKTNEVNKRRKRSRFQYVTPVLRLRTEQERQDLINAKISQILSDLPESAEDLPASALQVDSAFLRSMRCENSRVFNSDKINNFYVSSLGFRRDERWVCGNLLKNWDEIPGREISPHRSMERNNSSAKQAELSMSPVKQIELSTSTVEQKELLTSPVKHTELLRSHVKETKPSTCLVKQTVKQTQLLTSPVKQTVQLTSPVDQTELLMSPVKQTELSMSPVKQIELLMSPVKQTELLMSPVKQTEQLLSAVKQTELLRSHVKETKPSTCLVKQTFKQTELLTSTVKQTVQFTSPVNQTELLMSPVKQTELLMSPVNPIELLMSPVKQTELLMSRVKQRKLLMSPVKETQPSTSLVKQTVKQRELLKTPVKKTEPSTSSLRRAELSESHVEVIDVIELSSDSSDDCEKFQISLKRIRSVSPDLFESEDEICHNDIHRNDIDDQKRNMISDVINYHDDDDVSCDVKSSNDCQIDTKCDVETTEPSQNDSFCDASESDSICYSKCHSDSICYSKCHSDSISENDSICHNELLNVCQIEDGLETSFAISPIISKFKRKRKMSPSPVIGNEVCHFESYCDDEIRLSQKCMESYETDLSQSKIEKTLNKDDIDRVTVLSVSRIKPMDRQTEKTLDKDDIDRVTDRSVSRNKLMDRQTVKTLDKDDIDRPTDLSVSRNKLMDRQTERTLDKDDIDRLTDLSMSRNKSMDRQTEESLNKVDIDRVTDQFRCRDRTADNQTVTFLENSVLNDLCESVTVQVTDDSIEIISIKDSDSSLDVPEKDTQQQNVMLEDDLDLTALIRSLEDGTRLNKPVTVTNDVNITNKLVCNTQSPSQASSLNVTEFVNDILRDEIIDSDGSDDTILNLSQRIENFKVSYKARLSHENDELSDVETTSKKLLKHDSMESNFSQDSVYISDEELNYSSVYFTPKRQNNCQSDDDHRQVDRYDECDREKIVVQNDEFDDMCQFDRFAPKRQSDDDTDDDARQIDNYDDQRVDGYGECERERIVDQNDEFDDMCQFDRLVDPSVYVTSKRQNNCQSNDDAGHIYSYDEREWENIDQNDEFDDMCQVDPNVCVTSKRQNNSQSDDDHRQVDRYDECEREKIVVQNDEFDVCQFDRLVHQRVRDLSTKQSYKTPEVLNNKRQSLTARKGSTSDCQVVTPAKTDDGMIVKVTNVTPMPEYDRMNSPEIVAELSKFGLKRLKRKKGVQLLKYLYESTHPLLDEDDTQPVKRRKIFVEPTENCENIDNIHKDVNAGMKVEDMIFERKTSKKIMSCRLPLHVAFHNLVASQPAVLESILLYEPLQVELIYDMLKQHGHRYHIQDLISFLDRKCITFRLTPGSQEKPQI